MSASEPQSPAERDKARRVKRQAARNEEARSFTTSALVTAIASYAGKNRLKEEETLHLNACRTELDRRIPAEPEPFKPWTDEERAVLAEIKNYQPSGSEAEAQLASLREAALNVRGGIDISDEGGVGLWHAVVNDLDRVLAETEAAAKDYKRRVQAEALEEAAEECCGGFSPGGMSDPDDRFRDEGIGRVIARLRTRAAEIRGGAASPESDQRALADTLGAKAMEAAADAALNGRMRLPGRQPVECEVYDWLCARAAEIRGGR